jgi:hypothetical protein
MYPFLKPPSDDLLSSMERLDTPSETTIPIDYEQYCGSVSFILFLNNWTFYSNIKNKKNNELDRQTCQRENRTESQEHE